MDLRQRRLKRELITIACCAVGLAMIFMLTHVLAKQAKAKGALDDAAHPTLSTSRHPAPKNNYDRLAYAAEDIVDPSIIYDPTYRQISYPGGDVDAKHGVCADVLVRAYRRLNIDLQVLVHKDMQAHFSAYPQMWQLHRADSNIDHRRVFNLATFFQRHGHTLACSNSTRDYFPGDIVVWRVLNQGHIGIVSSQRNAANTCYLMVHNIGAGQVLEDMLFTYPIIGHYRYMP